MADNFRKIKNLFEIVVKKVSKLEKQQTLMAGGLKSLQKQQTVMSGQLDSVSEKQSAANKKIGVIEGKIGVIEGKQDVIEERLGVIEEKQDGHTGSLIKIESILKGYADMYKVNKEKTEELEERVETIEGQLRFPQK